MKSLPPNLEKVFTSKTLHLLTEMKRAVKSSSFGERLRNGFVITLIGRPNVGKSSLINFLSNRNISLLLTNLELLGYYRGLVRL